MANVNVEVPHTHSTMEAQRCLSGFSEDLAKVGAKLVWRGDRAEVQGLGVSGELRNDPGRIRIALKLGLAARVAGVDAARLEGTIRRRLEAALSAP